MEGRKKPHQTRKVLRIISTFPEPSHNKSGLVLAALPILNPLIGGMVRILANGEIVPDNDPRVSKARPQQGGGASSDSAAADTRRRWDGAVRGVHSPPLKDTPSRDGASSAGNPRAAAPASTNPLDQVAGILGVQGRVVTIPAIGPLNFSETNIDLIYLLILGLMVLIFGVNVLLLAAGVYAYMKYTENNNSRR